MHLIPDSRRAGALLLLTALATAISVPARLSVGADNPELPPELLRVIGDDEAARLLKAQSLSAIGAAKAAYATGGAARLVSGLALMAASLLMWRVVGAFDPKAAGLATLLLVASGIFTAVSGGCAIALASLAPEPQSSAVLVPGGELVGRVEDTLLTLRWATGALGFTLAGLALVALMPVQWRVGGVLRVASVIVAVLGLAMLFIWIDAATAVHRITGVGFLIWLIVAGLWLITGRVSPPPRNPPATSP
jgi:hypothetical protein